MKRYPHIFKPFRCKNLELNNRIIMMPMGTNYGEQTGEMSFLHIHYYEMRAKGGTGLIIMENVCVDHPSGSNGTTQLRIDQDNFIPRLFYFCECIHKQGAKVALQLNHAGASAMKSRTGLQPISASNIPSKEGGEIPRPLAKEELAAIAEKYGDAARRAVTAGFDAVEIHCGHSYLLSQFLSPTTNKRTDEYGGSPQNRARFPKMVVEAVRRAVGPNYPIILRISADELVEGGNSLEDTLELMRYFTEEADIFSVSCGLNSSIQYQIDSNFRPDGWRSYMARAVKEAFHKPVIAMGNMRDPKVVDELLAKGDADLIGMGRGLIADPDWVHKVQWGSEDMLRKCISCNVGCAGNRIGVNRPIRCTVNPCINQGEDYAKHKVTRQCNVVVIGGGAVGIDVVEYFAPRGADCSIVEMMPVIGRDLDPVSKNATKELFFKYHVKQYTETKLLKVQKDSFLVEQDGNPVTLPFDYGFVCLGMRSHSPLLQALRNAFVPEETEIYNIGDSVRARRIIDGVQEGHDILKILENRGFFQ